MVGVPIVCSGHSIPCGDCLAGTRYNDRIGNENIYFNRFERDKCFLMIGLTRYEMPPKHEDFEDFVRHCLDIEAAFYDNKRCLEVLDKAGPKV